MIDVIHAYHRRAAWLAIGALLSRRESLYDDCGGWDNDVAYYAYRADEESAHAAELERQYGSVFPGVRS